MEIAALPSSAVAAASGMLTGSGTADVANIATTASDFALVHAAVVNNNSERSIPWSSLFKRTPNNAGTMSENPSSHGSSSIPERVDLDIFGSPVSNNAAHISTRLGKLVRANIPISYKSWDKVPDTYKNDVWVELLKTYELDPLVKGSFFKKMAEFFRRHKADLRTRFYDAFTNDEDRIKNCPQNVAQENWEEFLKNEADSKAIERRERNKKNRSKLEVSHHSGRKSHAKIANEMLASSPTSEISRTQVWEKTHKKKDGSISDAASPYFDKIVLAKESLGVDDDYNLPLIEDTLSQVFGKDTRGRVRSVGNISSTQITSSAIARKKFIESEGHNIQVNSRLGNLEDQMKFLINIAKENMEKEKRASDNASGSGSQFIAPLFGAPMFMNSANVVNNQNCELLDFDFETIATGFVCRDSTSSTIHGKPMPATHEKVVLEKILRPDERTAKINHCLAEYFGEVGSGGYVAHPKNNIRYL